MSDPARILDQGYRRYDEERGTVIDAMRTVTLFSLGRVLGLRRGFWPKVLPITTIVISFLPAVVFVGMAALLPDPFEEGLPTYGEYYGFVTAAIIIFTAFVGPELLCPDRRNRMIGLYLASPLDRMTYLAAKGVAVIIALSIVTIGPPLLLLVANTIEGSGPDTISDFLDLLWRILLAGIVIAAVHTSLSLAVSSFTDRNGFASAAVILILLLSSAVSGSIVDGAGGSDALRAIDLFSLPFELVTRIFGDIETTWPEVSTGFLVAANLFWTALFTGVVIWRYRRLEVTR